MKRKVLFSKLILTVCFLLGAQSFILAQDVQPTATPVPTDAPVINTPAPPAAPRAILVEPTPAASPDATPQPQIQNLSTVPSIAPDFRGDAPPPILARVGVDMANQRPLSLREAIALALENNKDLTVSRQNVRIAEFDLLAARGAYDPRLVLQSYYERVTTPTASFFGGGQNGAVSQSGLVNNLGFQSLSTRYGGSYNASFSTQQQGTDNQFSALNPLFPTSLTFGYTQPLFRGRNFDAPRRAIEVAKKNLSLTDVQFRQRAIEIITNVQRAYWDLTYNLKNLQVQRDAVRDARAQVAHNKRLVEEGVLAPVDIIAAEAQVAQFEQNVYTALDDVNRAENTLKTLLAENRDAAIWSEALIPTDNVDLAPPSVELPEALQAALANRTELQQNNVSREINQLDQRLAREQNKLQLDLIGSYGVTGLAGTINNSGINPLGSTNALLIQRINELSGLVNPPLPPLPITTTSNTLAPELIGGFGQSLSSLFLNRYNNYRIGVQVTLPLKNRAAEAQLGRSLVEGERLTTQREQLEQNIQAEVRNALQGVRTSQAKLRSATAQRSAAEQQYASEQRKFDEGQSTVFLVLERQTALTNARGMELKAQTDLNKSIADLQRATGNALQANNVIVRVD